MRTNHATRRRLAAERRKAKAEAAERALALAGARRVRVRTREEFLEAMQEPRTEPVVLQVTPGEYVEMQMPAWPRFGIRHPAIEAAIRPFLPTRKGPATHV